ncbi:MAG TPA: hypothetical protein VHE81_06865, partial [Lacipirellulaceae bacterium]|nr:hypothetical protein [Lacipirellulaceae bacterium]
MNIKTVLCGSAFLALAVGAFMPGKALATPIIIPPTTLSVLIDHSGGANPSITIGSLTFSDFSYLGTGDMPSAGGVNVDAYVDPITNDIGLKFQGSFLDFPGSSGSDALIDFKVTENDPDKLVTSAALAGNPSVIPMGPGASGVASVTETFLPTNPTPQLTIFASLNNGVPGPTKLTDTGNFATGQSTVFVQKDVLTFNGTNSVPMLS